MPPSKRPPSRSYKLARRRLLESGVTIAVSSLLPVPEASLAADDNLPPYVPSRMKKPGAPILNPPYCQPSPFEKNVIRRMRASTPTQTAASSMTPLRDLHGILTGCTSSAVMPTYPPSIRLRQRQIDPRRSPALMRNVDRQELDP